MTRVSSAWLCHALPAWLCHDALPARPCHVLLALFLGGVTVAPAQQLFDRSHALVVGIDEYSSPRWQDLEYAVNDARAVADYLKSKNFEVTELYDVKARKDVIISKLHEIAQQLNEDDRVLFFFAGHGQTENLGGEKWGYVVPHDGAGIASYISMEELQSWSGKMRSARHQLFILDSCYSGLLGVRTRGARLLDPRTPRYIEELSQRKTRQVLTAGDVDEVVLDVGTDGHSLFTGYLLKGLRDGEANVYDDGFITFRELAEYVTVKAGGGNQTPVSTTLPGHDENGGQFFFSTAHKPPPQNRPPPPRAPPPPVQVPDRIHAYMSQVDDIGLVVILNESGRRVALQCEWTSGGIYGSASGSLSEYLEEGDNYIVFVLYNKVYSGGIIFAGGKWSFDFRLEKNGRAVWRDSQTVRENDADLKYWKAFGARVDRSGKVEIAENLGSAARSTIEAAMLDIKLQLSRSGTATPF